MEIAWSYAGENVSNNIVDYQGLQAAIRRADALGLRKVCLQTDSMLVAQQVNMRWACRQAPLQTLLSDILAVRKRMEARGTEVIIERIYREYSDMADKLANLAVATTTTSDWIRAEVGSQETESE